VDVITPIVDDPYTFGAICAANSLSDIYAMGGKPLTALAILGFASCDFGPSVIKSLLRGATDKLKEAGACLIGGHSIEDNEFKLGFAVTGVVDKKRTLTVSSASPGNILILTKPLGTGILTSAVKLNKMKKQGLNKAVSSMLTLNKSASETAVMAGARAATDVTGFGLLGHALNMAKSSHVNILIFYDRVPLMDKVKDFISNGVVPKGTRNNLKFFSKNVSFPRVLSHEEKLAFSDPQTSGGLLIALPQRGLKKFERRAQREKMPYWIIGEVIKGRGKIIIKEQQ
jgi:selenide,water dikinase